LLLLLSFLQGLCFTDGDVKYRTVAKKRSFSINKPWGIKSLDGAQMLMSATLDLKAYILSVMSTRRSCAASFWIRNWLLVSLARMS
jgi:hypothetical protein